MTQETKQPSDYYKSLTVEKAQHMFQQIEKELDTSLETCGVIDDKTTRILTFSIASIAILFSIIQFTNYKLSVLIMLIGFILCMFCCLKSFRCRRYMMRNYRPQDYMHESCVGQPYPMFLYSYCMTIARSVENNNKQNKYKNAYLRKAINCLLIGFVISLFVFAISLFQSQV